MGVEEEQGGFLSRWARRKAQARSGGTGPAEPAPAPVRVDTPPPARPPVQPPVASTAPADAAAVSPDDTAVAAPEQPAPLAAGAPKTAAPPPPTLEDAQALTPGSDFRRFARPDVDPQVRNLAMKKLFADPHFNVMDGLDIYIDDYNTPDPLPQSMLRQLVQARTLGLLDDELEEQPQPQAVSAPEGRLADAPPRAPGQAPEGSAEDASQPHAADPALADAGPAKAVEAAAEPCTVPATEPASGSDDKPASLAAATAGEPAANPAAAPVIPFRPRSPSPPAG